MSSRGFTLLEMMVATLVMGIAVVGTLSSFSTSLNNAARLTQYDRAAVLARHVMDELLIDQRLPLGAQLGDAFDPALTGGVQAGWTAQVTPFEAPPKAGPGTEILERIQLDVWWLDGAKRRTLTVEAFRRGRLPEGAQP